MEYWSGFARDAGLQDDSEKAADNPPGNSIKANAGVSVKNNANELTESALEEIILLYYETLRETEQDGKDPVAILQQVNAKLSKFLDRGSATDSLELKGNSARANFEAEPSNKSDVSIVDSQPEPSKDEIKKQYVSKMRQLLKQSMDPMSKTDTKTFQPELQAELHHEPAETDIPLVVPEVIRVGMPVEVQPAELDVEVQPAELDVEVQPAELEVEVQPAESEDAFQGTSPQELMENQDAESPPHMYPRSKFRDMKELRHSLSQMDIPKNKLNNFLIWIVEFASGAEAVDDAQEKVMNEQAGRRVIVQKAALEFLKVG
ncbi:hypothetical protein CYMTET_30553 [Cymbomonas tetramitiformis]|uniref:Uncharacterized protein n=1 Tax=Cymbomonas tetramitiformis TaxID=36881 RepID=A0AAE0KTT6_9CHLO|nr:hypothetical protein CYMTET_30553 [Cymbomonas tetramitiformis]